MYAYEMLRNIADRLNVATSHAKTLAENERAVLAGVDAIRARTEQAEAEAAKWRELHDDRDRDLAHEFDRANAAEAEVERLREAARAFYDTFYVDDEGGDFVYWTTKPRHVEAFEQAFNIDQDAP